MHSVENPPAAQARSKLEFLYRDLIAQIEGLQLDNHKLLQELQAASHTLSGAPQMLQRAAATATARATDETTTQLQLADAALTNARRDLRQLGQSLLATSSRNAWFVGALAFGCGLLGAMVGVVGSLFILAN